MNEIFYSLQGEGMLVGTPSVFVRLAGCPLRCRWCDTTYAWDYAAGEPLDSDQIVRQVSRWPCSFIVLTGGEPLAGPDLTARPDLADLTGRLKALGKHLTIETAGVLFIPDLACDLMSISPKLANSTPGRASPASDRCDWDAVRQLMQNYPYQLKFVVGSAEDVQEVRGALEVLGELPPERVMLMPQAATRRELLDRSPAIAEACKQAGLRFGERLHILLWDRQRGV